MLRKAIFFGLGITLCHFGIAAFTHGDWARAASNSLLQLSSVGAFVFLCRGNFIEIKHEKTEE
jgi:hypothetical protein